MRSSIVLALAALVVIVFIECGFANVNKKVYNPGKGGVELYLRRKYGDNMFFRKSFLHNPKFHHGLNQEEFYHTKPMKIHKFYNSKLKNFKYHNDAEFKDETDPEAKETYSTIITVEAPFLNNLWKDNALHSEEMKKENETADSRILIPSFVSEFDEKGNPLDPAELRINIFVDDIKSSNHSDDSKLLNEHQENDYFPNAKSVPVLVPIPQPYPVEIPVLKPYPVPVLKEIRVPIERIVPYPIIKKVPYLMEKPVPVPIEKKITIMVPKPYPVPMPILKTIHHHHKPSTKYERRKLTREYYSYSLANKTKGFKRRRNRNEKTLRWTAVLP